MRSSSALAFAITFGALLGTTSAFAALVGYSLSPQVKIKDSERIAGFEITLTNGTFRSFNGIPEGWYFRLDNSTHQDQSLIGEISVGAGALYRNQLSNTWICVAPGDLPGAKFTIRGNLEVTTDFEKTRKVLLTQADFVSRPCAPPAPQKSQR
jgi:hypothetical protein